MPESTTSDDGGAVVDHTDAPASITGLAPSEPARAATLPLDQTFRLRPPPPLRATAIAAVAAVAGAVVIVLSTHPVPLVIGSVLLAFGVLLALTAFILASRLRATVRLDASAISVTRAGRTGTLAWQDVDKVAESGQRLIVLAGGDRRDLVIAVPGRRGRTYDDLLASLRRRLDDSRGYRG